MVALRPLDDANRQAVLALRVAPHQERFVSSVTASLLQATEHPAARALPRAVYADDVPVGFVVVCDEVDHPDYTPRYLWKLLIDARHQRRGYGTAAVDLVVEHFRGRPGADALSTSAREGKGSPLPFYERYGFERTGRMHGDDVLLHLRLT